MGELQNFRMMRSPQRKIPDPNSTLPTHKTSASKKVEPALFSLMNLLNGSLSMIKDSRENATTSLVNNFLSGNAQDIFNDLIGLDIWLTRYQNKPPIDALKNALKNEFKNLSHVIDSEIWLTVHNAIGNGILISIVYDFGPDKKQYYSRLLMICGLVDLLSQLNTIIATPDDVYHALRWRKIVIPINILNALQIIKPDHSIVLRSGFADLYTVREEWNRYEPAEIAYIQNVLPGESTIRELVNTNETTTTTTVSQEKSQMTEQDNQTTDRFNLQSESKDDIQLATHLDGKLDTSGTYGPTTVNTHIGGSLDFSQDHSTEQAVTQTKENISRAVTKVEEKITQIRTTTTLVKTTEKNKHSIDNSGKDSAVVGLYRWVDKINRVQVIRYPHRYLLEFEIPEPGAWIRWLHKNDNTKALITEEPIPFTYDGTTNTDLLNASMIRQDNYASIGSRYAAAGLNPYPQKSVVISVALKRELSGDELTIDDPSPRHFGFHIDNDTSLGVPTGYKAVSWSASFLSDFDWRYQNNYNGGLILISVGAGDPVSVSNDQSNNVLGITTSGNVGSISTGNIPISVYSWWEKGFAINVEITCELLEEKIEQWQNDTYDKIASAYYALKQQHEDEIAQKQIQTGVTISGDSPERNQEIIKEELKRQVIEMLIGRRFIGYPALDTTTPDDSTGPYVDLEAAKKVASEIQFIEQAFEWENLTYIVYPYYWADRKDWKDLEPIESADPDFDRFLRSGSARVIVPARPMFESDVQFYAKYGIIWGGGSIPAPDDPDYLSIATEIKEIQQGASDGVNVDAWEVRLPTTLVWLDNQTSLPTNPHATITDDEIPPSQTV